MDIFKKACNSSSPQVEYTYKFGEGIMKKPFAMIQNVNYLLPPKILNKQGANISANTKSLVQTYE